MVVVVEESKVEMSALKAAWIIEGRKWMARAFFADNKATTVRSHERRARAEKNGLLFQGLLFPFGDAADFPHALTKTSTFSTSYGLRPHLCKIPANLCRCFALLLPILRCSPCFPQSPKCTPRFTACCFPLALLAVRPFWRVHPPYPHSEQENKDEHKNAKRL